MADLNMNKLVDLNGVGAIRDWVRENFLLKSEVEQMLTLKIQIIFGSDFEGKTYTITGGANETYTGTVPTALIVEQSIKTLNAVYTVSCDTTESVNYKRTVEVGSYYGVYTLKFLSFLAYLDCTADAGATIVATNGAASYTGIADRKGECTLIIATAGTYSVTATLNGKTTDPVSIEITTSDNTYTCSLPSLQLKIVPWATGTDKEIAAMLDAAKEGTIDLQTDGGWVIGDVRTIQITEFTDGNKDYTTQSIDIVISSFDNYNDCGAVMQFDFKDALTQKYHMNSSNTNTGSYGASVMKTTTLPGIVNTLPEWLKTRLLEFSVWVSAEKQSDMISVVTGNKLALRSEIEIYGTTTYSKMGEGSQIPYYSIEANRLKKIGHFGSVDEWWLRSPYWPTMRDYCVVGRSGRIETDPALNLVGLAPFGCV